MGGAPQHDRDYYTQILGCLMGVAIVFLWILPLWKGFWVDECLVLWTIGGGFWQIIPRSFISLQSIAFSFTEWGVSRLGAATEPAFRLPSLIAGVITLYVLYRLGAEVMEREFGLTLAALFTSLPLVASSIPDARPYAIAMLAQACGMLWLFRWLKSSRIRDGLLWVAFSAAAVYFHHLFLVAFVMEGIYATAALRRRFPKQLGQWLVCGAASMVLLSPLLPQLLIISRQSQLLSLRTEPSWSDLLRVLAPPTMILAVVLVVALEWAAGCRARWKVPSSAALPVLGACLLIPPVIIFFGVSKFTSVSLFVSRYILPSMTGGLLLWGWLLRGLEPARLRRMSIMAAVVFGSIAAVRLAAHPGYVPAYRNEDWRAAASAAPDSGQYLIYPGLVETRRLEWLQAPEHERYFVSPVTVFRPALRLDDAHVVPFDFGGGEKAYMQPVVDGVAKSRQSVTLIARGYPNGLDWAEWLSSRLAGAGYRKLRDARYGELIVMVWMPSA